MLKSEVNVQMRSVGKCSCLYVTGVYLF